MSQPTSTRPGSVMHAATFQEDSHEARESQATELVNLVRSACFLMHDENGDVYAQQILEGEVRNIERRTFRTWLAAEYFERYGKAARAQAISEALMTLGGIGRHSGKLVQVHIRCATVPSGGYVLDLGEEDSSRAVLVEPGRWDIVSLSHQLFVRPETMRPLPVPVGGGSLEPLWQMANVPEASRLLVVAWLLDAMRPDTDFPLLELVGEQGSAKSVTQGFLRALVDPSTVDLRRAPKCADDVYVGAGNGWLLAYDNISHLSTDMQDTLCCLSTGAANATRKLYTNGEESSIRAKRPVSLNGISVAVTAQDLVDRTISVVVPVLPCRVERRVVEARFRAQHAQLFGALLDLFAAALAHLPAVEIPPDRRPRMLEFAALGCALARAQGLPDEVFLGAYQASRMDAIARTVDASPVAGALLEWLEEGESRFGEHTIKHLFSVADSRRPPSCEAWPRSAHGFANQLRRVAPALRALKGIEIGPGRQSNGQTWVCIARKARSEVTGVTEVTGGVQERVPGEDDDRE